MDTVNTIFRPVTLLVICFGAVVLLFGAMALNLIGAHRQAEAERPRVQSLVEAVVSAELDAHKAKDEYLPIDFGADIPSVHLTGKDEASIRFYAVEARHLPNGTFRVQAWPRPDALAKGRASAVSYYVVLSADGTILDQGWAGSDSDAAQ